MIGISLHSRSRLVTSTPSMSGSIRSTIAAAGGLTAARSSASSPLSAGDRLVAGVAQDHLQRPQDLRLVVADEDPGAAPLIAGPPAPGSETTKLLPWPGTESTAISPPLASTKPLAIASPRPAPPCGAARPPCWNGSKIRCRSLSGIPGPWSTTRTTILSPTQPRLDQDRPAAAVADRVLEQVGEGALELGGVGLDQRQVAVDREPHRLGPRRSPRERRRAPRRGRPPRGGARPCPPPAATCRAGSRPGARAARPRRRSPRSARPAPRRSSVAEPSAAPLAMIEVSGVRRSWEIERSSAVFSSSLRRSASASTISACIRSRSSASAASSASARSACSRPPLGLERLCPRQAGDGAADRRDDHEGRQRDPVLFVGDREAVQRRDLEEVEGDGAGDRGEQAQPQAPDDRDQQDRRQVDDAERDNRRDRLQRVDDQRAGDDRGERRQQPQPGGRRLAAQAKRESTSTCRRAGRAGDAAAGRRRRGRRRRRFGRGFRSRFGFRAPLPCFLPLAFLRRILRSILLLRIRCFGFAREEPEEPRCGRCRGRRVRAASTVRGIRGSRRRRPIP